MWRNKKNYRCNLSKICRICFKIWARTEKFQWKKFHEIIVKAFFINKTNENYLNPTLIPKVIFMSAIKQTTIYLLMHLINGMLMIMATCKLVTVKVLSKNLIGFQKINKANKAFRWSFHISQSLCNRYHYPCPVHSVLPTQTSELPILMDTQSYIFVQLSACR